VVANICSSNESQRLLTVFDWWHHATVKRVLNALPVIFIYVPACAFCPTLYFSILSPSFILSSLISPPQRCLLSSLTFIPLLSLFSSSSFPPSLIHLEIEREGGREREREKRGIDSLRRWRREREEKTWREGEAWIGRVRIHVVHQLNTV
jgi:hypothetical protein